MSFVIGRSGACVRFMFGLRMRASAYPYMTTATTTTTTLYYIKHHLVRLPSASASYSCAVTNLMSPETIFSKLTRVFPSSAPAHPLHPPGPSHWPCRGRLPVRTPRPR